MHPDRRKRFTRPSCRVRGRQTSVPPQTHRMMRGHFRASSSGEAAPGPRDPGSDGPGCVRGPAALLASPAIKTTSGRLSRTVAFRPPADGPSVCGRSDRRHHPTRRRGRVLLVGVCLAVTAEYRCQEGAAMIARGNVLNRIALPEGTESSGPLTGYSVARALKQREPPA
jgi:hypothetical protein